MSETLAQLEHRATLARIAAERLRTQIEQESRAAWLSLNLYQRARRLAVRLLRRASEQQSEALRRGREIKELDRALRSMGLSVDQERLRRLRSQLNELAELVASCRAHN